MGRSVNRYSDVVAYMTHEPQCTCEYNEDTQEHVVKDICECDSDCGHFEWENFKEWLTERILSKYPSAYEVENEWVDNEGRIIAENDHAQFVLSEYCGCVSLSVVSKADDHRCDCEDGKANLADGWVNRIHEGFDKEFSEIKRIGGFSDGTSIYERVKEDVS